MSFINDKTKEINCKIVYYGPPLCGKSTSLRYIYGEIRRDAKGEMVSLSSDKDRTLYFDFVPLNLGKVSGYTVRIHLYTVPGEVGYRQSRMLISKGVDGVVFMADSALERMEENLKALSGLKDILKSEGHAWGEVPLVYQYNKRDLPNAIPVNELRHYINRDNSAEFETVATNGTGVFEAFKAISQAVLADLKGGGMNRKISGRWILTAAACVLTLSLSLQAMASSKKEEVHTVKKTQQKKAPPAPDITITPEDVTRWCRNNPRDCNAEGQDSYPTLTLREMQCIDTLGDNDGTVTAWEYEKYNAQCP